MERPCVFDAHCDTISRCWREYEDLDRNSGAVDLERKGRGCWAAIRIGWSRLPGTECG